MKARTTTPPVIATISANDESKPPPRGFWGAKGSAAAGDGEEATSTALGSTVPVAFTSSFTLSHVTVLASVFVDAPADVMAPPGGGLDDRGGMRDQSHRVDGGNSFRGGKALQQGRRHGMEMEDTAVVDRNDLDAGIFQLPREMTARDTVHIRQCRGGGLCARSH